MIHYENENTNPSYLGAKQPSQRPTQEYYKLRDDLPVENRSEDHIAHEVSNFFAGLYFSRFGNMRFGHVQQNAYVIRQCVPVVSDSQVWQQLTNVRVTFPTAAKYFQEISAT